MLSNIKLINWELISSTFAILDLNIFPSNKTAATHFTKEMRWFAVSFIIDDRLVEQMAESERLTDFSRRPVTQSLPPTFSGGALINRRQNWVAAGLCKDKNRKLRNLSRVMTWKKSFYHFRKKKLIRVNYELIVVTIPPTINQTLGIQFIINHSIVLWKFYSKCFESDSIQWNCKSHRQFVVEWFVGL